MRMTSAVCTITDSSFEPGCGVLVNSLLQNGFRGKIVIGLIGKGHRLPGLIRKTKCDNAVFEFVELSGHGNPHRYKPDMLLHCFKDADISSAFFFDSDIICTKDWGFYQDWICSGIAVCSDINHLWMPPNHPV